MNDELLQLVYSKFKTEASFEDFKRDFQENEELRQASYGKLKTESSYDDFIKDIGYEKPKKEIAVSTESPLDSAQKPSDSAIPQETQEVEETTSDSQLDKVEDLPVNEDITSIYDRYKEAGKITLPQQEEIRIEIDKQKRGDRSVWEDVGALTTGMLTTGMFIPLYRFDTTEQLTEKRIQKNKVDFLSELPEEKVRELNEYAVNRTIELSNINKNILAENYILEEKGKLIVSNLKHQLNTIKEIQDSGKIVPEEGIEMYENLYKELEGISRLYNDNVDIIESNEEDIGDFYEELDLLKKNYGGLDYYKDVTRLATADMIGGLMEFGISTLDIVSPIGIPTPNIEGHRFAKEFREEVGRQRELLRPQLAVGDIESPLDFGKWLAEQVATQLPVMTVLIATGGTVGLSALGASAGGQKMGQLRDENDEVSEGVSELEGEVEEMTRIIDEREKKGETQVDAEGVIISISLPIEYDVSLEKMKEVREEAYKKLEGLKSKGGYTQLEIYLAGVAVGTAEFLSERVSLGILSKGKRSLSAINKSGLNKEFRKGIGTYAKESLFAGFSEGASETGNQWAQNLIDMFGLNKKDVHVFDGTEDALASGFALGVGMRAVPTIVGLGGKAFMDKTVRRKIIANTNKIEGYLSELQNNPNLSKESKKFLQKRVDNLTKETQQDFIRVLEKLPEIGEEGIKRLIKLDKKSNGILQLVKELEKTNLSEEVKTDIKLDYKKQIDKINEEKNTLLDIKKEGKKLTFLERQGFDDVSDRMRWLIDDIEYQEFKIKKDSKLSEEVKQKLAELVVKRKVELKKLREKRLSEGGKGWWLKDDIKDGTKQEIQPKEETTEEKITRKRDEVEARVDEGAKRVKDVQEKDGIEPSVVDDGKGVQQDIDGDKGEPTVEGANKYKNKTADVLQTEVVAKFGLEKFSDAVIGLGIKTYTNERGKTEVNLTREQLENVAEELGFKDTYVEPTQDITTKEFSKLDLSEDVGINKALDVLDSWSKSLDKAGKETIGMNIPVVVAQGMVAAMKVAVKAAKTGADVLSAGINHLKSTDWYKKLSDKDKKSAEKEVIALISTTPKKLEGRKGIEEELDVYLKEGKTELESISQFKTKKERMIAKDILERRKPVDKKSAYKKANESYDRAKKEMTAKKGTVNFFKKGLRKIAKNLWDRQYLPKMLLMKAGGKLIRNYIITSKGASGFARYNFDKAYDKIYKGISSKKIETLDKIILQMRFIAIDKNRESRDLDPIVHPDFQSRGTAEAYLSELKNELGTKEYNDLVKRANSYFDAFTELLDSMHESGIINKEFRDSFFDVDYQPRLFLQFLTNQEQEMSIVEMGAPESASLGSKQIQELESGSNESLIVDSMYLLGRSMNTRAKSNALNITNRKLAGFMETQAEVVEDLKKKKKPTRKEKKIIKYFTELSSRVRINPIVGFTESGNPKYKHIPKFGEKSQAYYVDGVKNQLLMEESFFDQYNDNLKAIFNNSDVREKAALISLTALVKTIATGNNPAFFITNSPRDFMFIATFSEEYTSMIPVNMVMIAIDTYKGIKDMRKDGKMFQEFVKHGGMLDFLHTQGKFKGTNTIRRIINNVVDNRVQEAGKTIFNWITFNKLQMYSEIGFRMGVFNRSIINQLKELNLNKIEDATKEQTEDIYTNAAASARNTTDFSQGGIYTKDIDAVVPYLNAGVQGTRVAVEALNERPVETMLRMAQSATILSAVPIAISLYMLGSADREEGEEDFTPTEMYLKAMEGVSKYDRINYQIYFTGKRTDEGEFEFVRLSKPHFLTPLISYANNLQIEVMKKGVGWESKDNTIEDIKFALEKNISPIDMSVTGNIAKNPILKAALTYTTGYDFYRNQDLSHLRGKVPVPVEGHESKAVEEFYKKIGENFLISPARMKGAVESMITTPSTSPFVGILYGGLDVALADKDSADSMGDIKKSFLKSVTGRFHKSTSAFNRRTDWDKFFFKEFSRADIKNLENKSIFKDLAIKLIAKETGNKEINEQFKRMAEDDPFEFERLVKTFTATIQNPNTNPVILDLKFRKPYQRALILAEIFGDKLLDEKKEMGKINKKLKNELFSQSIMNTETIVKYLEIVKNKKGDN